METDIFINMEVNKEKYQRPQLEVSCSNLECGKTFMKDGSEVRRNLKLGRANYCSLKCSGKMNSKHLLTYDNVPHLVPSNRRDKYTGLREHLTRVKQRSKEYNITLEDLLIQWNVQNGTCPYTGLKLINPIDSKDEPLFKKASLDRVNYNLGYIKGNIQFISASANHAKNSMSHEEMVEFCKLISEYWKDK